LGRSYTVCYGDMSAVMAGGLETMMLLSTKRHASIGGHSVSHDNLGNRTSVTKRDTAADAYALDSATNRYDASTGGPYCHGALQNRPGMGASKPASNCCLFTLFPFV